MMRMASKAKKAMLVALGGLVLLASASAQDTAKVRNAVAHGKATVKPAALTTSVPDSTKAEQKNGVRPQAQPKPAKSSEPQGACPYYCIG